MHLVNLLKDSNTVMMQTNNYCTSLTITSHNIIDDNLNKSYPLPHMYVVKDLVPHLLVAPGEIPRTSCTHAGISMDD